MLHIRLFRVAWVVGLSLCLSSAVQASALNAWAQTCRSLFGDQLFQLEQRQFYRDVDPAQWFSFVSPRAQEMLLRSLVRDLRMGYVPNHKRVRWALKMARQRNVDQALRDHVSEAVGLLPQVAMQLKESQNPYIMHELQSAVTGLIALSRVHYSDCYFPKASYLCQAYPESLRSLGALLAMPPMEQLPETSRAQIEREVEEVLKTLLAWTQSDFTNRKLANTYELQLEAIRFWSFVPEMKILGVEMRDEYLMQAHFIMRELLRAGGLSQEMRMAVEQNVGGYHDALTDL